MATLLLRPPQLTRALRNLTNIVVAFWAAGTHAIPAQIPGDLDLTFGGGAGTIASLVVGPGTQDHLTAMAFQPDGKIVLAGYCDGPTSQDFCVTRLLSDGTLDASFVGPNGNGGGKFLLDISNAADTARAIAIQPDGKTLIAGTCYNGVNNDFCIARLNPNGSRDSTFNGPSGAGNGQVMLPIAASDDFLTAMALQPDGKIVLVGYCAVNIQNDFCAARLNVDGTFDAGFVGPNGTGAGKFTFGIGISNDYAYAVALQPDGMIVIAGECVSPMVDNDFCIARLTSTGAYDVTFDGPSAGSNGKFLLPIGTSNDSATALVMQPDGKIILAGRCLAGIANNDFCVARLNSDGSFDATFDGPSGGANGKFLLPITAAKSDSVSALALQPDGKILLGGHCDNGGNEDLCVARLHIDGSLDQSYDGPGGAGNGEFLLPIGTSDDVATAMQLQPDGKVVIAGDCYSGATNRFCVARLYGGPFGYKSCSMDIDDDGKVMPTTDGLLLARISTGFTGVNALSGALGNGATRNTWPNIRDYLVTQCGMTVSP
ncbi:MAG: delta-60 repeat domain-containing protein [Casimicrobium sp.]